MWGIVILAVTPHMIVLGKELTMKIVNNWPSMPLTEKLDYLLTPKDWYQYQQEFRTILNTKEDENLNQYAIISSQSTGIARDDINNVSYDRYNDYISHDVFFNYHSEYQEERIIEEFWQLCDTNGNNLLNLEEYVICRGIVDSHGNPYERNEFDYIEEVIIKEFWDKVSQSDYQPDIYRYDENGIIIDDE